MSSLVLSNARLTVLVGALAAVGSVLDTASASLLIVVSLTVAIFCILLFSLRFLKEVDCKCVVIVLGLSLLPLLFFVYANSKHVRPPATDLSAYSGKSVVFLAFARASDLSSGSHEVTLEPVKLEFPYTRSLSGKTQLSLRGIGLRSLQEVEDLKTDNDDPENKVLIRIRGYVAAARTDVKPWEFDKARWLAKDGIFSSSYLAREKEGKPDSLSIASQSNSESVIASVRSNDAESRSSFFSWYESQMQGARKQIVQTHQRFLPTKLADLLSSMVLGNRAIALPQEITYKFRDVGLSHILAASGFNLTIVIAMTFAICRYLVPWAVPANILCFLSMLSFVSLAGPSPSVLRAALMCTIMLAARAGKRRLRVSSTLAGAFLITVLFDPVCTNDLGLQLSYAATVGIVVGTTALSDSFYVGLSRGKKMLADALSVVLVAQFSVLPIQLFYFWKTGTLFVPANLVITPLVTPLTMLGFASSALALLAPLQIYWQAFLSAVYPVSAIFQAAYFQSPIDLIISVCDAVAFIPLAAMMLLVNVFASVESAKIALGPPSVAAFVCYYVALLLWFASLRMQRFKAISLFIFALSIVFLVWRPTPPLMSIAKIHGQVVLVSAERTATVLNPAKSPDKMVDRFIAYNAAHVSDGDFKTGRLSSTLHYALHRRTLTVYPDEKPHPKHEQHSFAVQDFSGHDAIHVLAKARQDDVRKIVLVVSKSDAMTELLPSSGFSKCLKPHQTELYGWRNCEAILYTKD